MSTNQLATDMTVDSALKRLQLQSSCYTMGQWHVVYCYTMGQWHVVYCYTIGQWHVVYCYTMGQWHVVYCYTMGQWHVGDIRVCYYLVCHCMVI